MSTTPNFPPSYVPLRVAIVDDHVPSGAELRHLNRERITNLERKLNEATKALDWIKTRSQMEGTPDPFAEKIVAVADEALKYVHET